MRRRQRGVALQVDDDLGRAAQKRQRLGAALGAVAGGLGRHQDIGAEAARRLGDAVVIGQNEDGVDARDRAGRVPAAVDERARFAGGPRQHGQRFAGKALGGIARGDEDDGVHGKDLA